MKQNEINKLKPDRDDRQQRENERSFAPPNHPAGGGEWWRGEGGKRRFKSENSCANFYAPRGGIIALGPIQFNKNFQMADRAVASPRKVEGDARADRFLDLTTFALPHPLPSSYLKVENHT